MLSAHNFTMAKRVRRTLFHALLILVTLLTMASCQPRASVSPAPPTPQVDEQPVPVLENQSTRAIKRPDSSVPWPPPPPPLPKSAADDTVTPKSQFTYLRRTPPPAPKPTADATASIEDAAAGRTTAPPGTKPADVSAAKIEDTATTPKPVPLAPKPADGSVAKLEDAATTPKPVPLAPKPADGSVAKLEDAATTPKPVPSAAEPKPDATVAPKKPSWKNVRSATAIADQNIFYDEDNLSYQTLQKANQALQGFPLVKEQGGLDWGEALSSGLIAPRATLSGEGTMMVLDLDIVMKDTKSTPYVRFAHKIHTQWLECSNCHPQIFIPMIGANPISKAAILDGKFCGVCHNTVAFTTGDCERCHNVPPTQ